MFKSKHKIDPDQTDTLIGLQTSIEGNINTEASVRIEGKIKGDIQCKGDCIVGEKGVVESNIKARNVIIAGSVNGDIVAHERLTIHKSGSLTGNASSKSIIIEEGGSFIGNNFMNTKESQAQTEKKNVSGRGNESERELNARYE